MDQARIRVFAVLEEGERLLSRLFNGFIMVLIILNLIAIILESVEDIYTLYQSFFVGFEIFSVAVFSIEYLLRLWVCCEKRAYQDSVRGRLRYMVSFMAMVDLLAILPFYLSMLMGIDTRFLRVLRLLRVFKLTRHFQSLEILMQVIRTEGPVLASALFVLFVLFVLAVLAAGGIYAVEHDIQPDAFGSIPASMWWAIVTLITVGYGDVIPVSGMGRVFAAVITMLGVGMAALPAGIIASGFMREMQKRREIYQSSLREALEDGVITDEEREQLEKVRQHLGLNIDDTKAMNQAELSFLHELQGSQCPHCGEHLFARNDEGQQKG